MPNLPTTMRALIQHDYALGFDGLRCETVPLPALQEDELLVRIAYAPINPADIGFIHGSYPIRASAPAVPGREGGGTVVAVGAAVDAAAWLGKRVACLMGRRGGSYGEYAAVPVYGAFPVADSVSDQQAAMRIINPVTAWGLLHTARASGAAAVVQSAAGSQLGRMIIQQAALWGIPTINLVRRAEQIDELAALDAAHTLVTSTPDWETRLRDLAHDLKATYAFDAVGGDMTLALTRALPERGVVVVYGGLSGAPARADIGAFIFQRRRVEGFWLNHWMPDHPADLAQAWLDIQAPLYDSQVQAVVPLSEAVETLRRWQSGGGKVLFSLTEGT